MIKNKSTMDLSIVTTLYYSAPYLEEFYERASRTAEELGLTFEIIFVNDGSPDDSALRVLELRERDERVCLVDLSRNFGHHKAMMTGLSFAQGELVFLLDVDLEEAPELLSNFYTEMQSSGAEVVYGVREKREDKGMTRLFATLYWKLFSWLSNISIPGNQLNARLMTKRYVSSLLNLRDKEVFMPGLWALTGFKQVPVVARKTSKGESTYTFRKRMSQMVDSVTSFSNKPLFLIFNLGIIIALLSACAGGYLIIRRVFFDNLLEGWPSLMVAIWFLGGLTLFALGTIGIYLAKTYNEVKQRPLTIVRSVHRGAARVEQQAVPASSLPKTKLTSG